MIRTKKILLEEVKKFRKKRKKLQLEYLQLHQIDMLSQTGVLIQKELHIIEGKIDSLLWQAHTVPPKIKTKKK